MKKLVVALAGLVLLAASACGCGGDGTGDGGITDGQDAGGDSGGEDSGGGDADGGDQANNCISHDKTYCSQGITYWQDSCGNQEEIAETCNCGCNSDYSGCKDCGCVPACTGKCCGDDGCGNSCPDNCTGGQTCDTQSCTCQGGPADVLAVDCDVPFVLDASKVSDMAYMTGHFGDLVQQYGISGTVQGVDITGFPEKMYYGMHDSGNTLSLLQVSMNASLGPEYSVRIDFSPDTDVSTGAMWTVGVGINPKEALVGLIRHLSASSMCLFAMGTAGQLTFSAAEGCTNVEGGSFSVSGQMNMANPWDVADACSNTPPNLPCCQ
jgi:hypothetical protein